MSSDMERNSPKKLSPITIKNIQKHKSLKNHKMLYKKHKLDYKILLNSLVRMQEMLFQGTKFTKCPGGACPRTPLEMRIVFPGFDVL